MLLGVGCRMSADPRTLTLAIIAVIFLILFKLEIFDFEMTIVAFLVLFILAINAVIVLLLQIEQK